MEKFQNKYRIPSARAYFWNYGWNALYFVTICTHHRICWFGNISEGEMKLSEIGKLVNSEWVKTFEMRPDMNLHMGEYVVMPNHFHAVIGIGENQYNMQSMDMDAGQPLNKFGPQSKNLASLIRGFKAGVSILARQIEPQFRWQSRFHDHIIRDDESFLKISDYIKNNPAKWVEDKFYTP